MTHSNEIPPAVDLQLMELVFNLERDGYGITVDPAGSGVYIKVPRGRLPEKCGKARFNAALRADPELDAYLVPFLLKYRPYQSRSVQ